MIPPETFAFCQVLSGIDVNVIVLAPRRPWLAEDRDAAHMGLEGLL
jgi:hypothetical protein